MPYYRAFSGNIAAIDGRNPSVDIERKLVLGVWFAGWSAAMLAAAPAEAAPAIAPAFAADYTLTDLGPVAGVPDPYGGLVFQSGGTSTILLGGDANTAGGGMYSVPVIRGAGGHIVGVGAATLVAPAPYNDGGWAYGATGVLFLSQWPINGIAQYKPGSIPGPGPDKTQDVTPLGVAVSQAALQFVPSTFGGAGKFKGLSWEGGEFYTFGLAPDGGGTFDVTSAVQETALGGGPEGFVYIKNTNPGFALDSMLVSEFSANKVAAYTLDADGNPIPATRVDFITGLDGAEGAGIDPVTGDFLFSTFGTAEDHLIAVRGFVPPPPLVPEPASLALLASALAGLLGLVRFGRA
jgi:hypothetical protein